ncbi:maleylpyruvate isomerase N-terminal domain-containing protein [Polymorphospora lycopeni]|uniref:Maleylpyruvate isomerase N-terminal domain-containing protein n=1 Tax=Polymorphospora lycopeni TaxID=3140240 RepID=A0ABV5CUA8_9ACTN
MTPATDPADLTEMAGIDPFDVLDTEAARVDAFYRGLSDAGWSAPTRCPGWDRRDLLAHLTTTEDYTHAGLNGRVEEFEDDLGGADLDDRNARGIARRAGLPPATLLAEWRAASADNRRRLRERGERGTLQTAAGDYPVGRQVFYLASELATHADDAGVPQSPTEREERLQWRVRFARLAVAEAGQGVVVTPDGGIEVIRLAGQRARLSESDFVEAVADRLGDGALPDDIREALVVLA